MQSRIHTQDGGTAPGETTVEAGRDRRRLTVFLPAYGPVEAVLGLGLLFVLVDRVTPVVVDALATTAPTLVPDPFTTLMAMVLWLVTTVVLVTAALAQVRDNPRTFDTEAARDAFLDERRPRGRHYRVNAMLAVLGGVIVGLAWETATTVLPALVVIVAETGTVVPAALTPGNVAAFAIFFLGFAAMARGLDRLAIGVLRAAIGRRTRR